MNSQRRVHKQDVHNASKKGDEKVIVTQATERRKQVKAEKQPKKSTFGREEKPAVLHLSAQLGFMKLAPLSKPATKLPKTQTKQATTGKPAKTGLFGTKVK